MNRLLFLNAIALENKGNIAILIYIRPHGQIIGFPALSRCGIDVLEIRLICLIQKNIPEYAVVSEHILAFQVGTVAPAMHYRKEFVLPFPDMVCQIKFGNVVGTFRIADIGTIQIHIHTGRDTQKGNNMPFLRFLYLDFFSIHAYEIVFFLGLSVAKRYLLVYAQPGKHSTYILRLGNVWRVKWERITDIDIERAAVPTKLPA